MGILSSLLYRVRKFSRKNSKENPKRYVIGDVSKKDKVISISQLPPERNWRTKITPKYFVGNPFQFTNLVSIELSNLCNYSDFHRNCPLHHSEEPEILSSEIVNHVVDTLSQFNYKGTITFQVYNEPLIDPRLFKFIEDTKNACPDSSIFFWTNGFYLNEILIKELASIGVAKINISCYSKNDFERFINIRYDIPVFPVRMILDDRLCQYDKKIIDCDLPCYSPLNELIITCDAKVNLCCRDWRRDYIFGDLKKQTLEEIIRKGELHAVYEYLSKGNRFLELCKRCSWSISNEAVPSYEHP